LFRAPPSPSSGAAMALKLCPNCRLPVNTSAEICHLCAAPIASTSAVRHVPIAAAVALFATVAVLARRKA
jgi:predicted amidophosphoribosyltransferase